MYPLSFFSQFPLILTSCVSVHLLWLIMGCYIIISYSHSLHLGSVFYLYSSVGLGKDTLLYIYRVDGIVSLLKIFPGLTTLLPSCDCAGVSFHRPCHLEKQEQQLSSPPVTKQVPLFFLLLFQKPVLSKCKTKIPPSTYLSFSPSSNLNYWQIVISYWISIFSRRACNWN